MFKHYSNNSFGSFKEKYLIFKEGGVEFKWNSEEGKAARKKKRQERRADRHERYNKRADTDQERREKRDAEGKFTMDQISMPGTGAKIESEVKLEAPTKEPKSIEELLTSTGQSLSHLKVDVDNTAKYHKTPYGPGSVTRDVEAPKTYYKESVDLARKRDILEGQMSAEELQLMEDYHQSIYQHYLSPAFGFRLKQEGIANEVYGAFLKVMKTPEDFRYTMVDEDRLEVRFRDPETPEEGGFRLIFEGPSKGLVQVNNIDVRKVIENDVARPHEDSMTGQIGALMKRFDTAYKRGVQWDKFDRKIDQAPTEDEKDQLYLEQFFDSYRNVPEELKEIHEYMNIDFPRHLVEMIEARGLDFELSDPKFVDLKKSLERQGDNYQEITEDQWKTESKLQVMVTPSSSQEGVYVIWTRNNYKNPLLVSKDGKIMKETSSGAYVEDANYEKILSREYYSAHPKAEEASKKAGEKVDINEESIREKTEAQKEADFRYRVEHRMNQERTLEPLKNLAKSISPTDFHAAIDQYEGNTEENREMLIEGIKKLLENDPTRWDTVAEFYSIKRKEDVKTEKKPNEKPNEDANKNVEEISKALEDISPEKMEEVLLSLAKSKPNTTILIERKKLELKSMSLEGDELNKQLKEWYIEQFSKEKIMLEDIQAALTPESE